MKLGLTGGIGCGKSTFGKMLAARGARLVQTDLVARDILNTPEVLARVRALFGPEAIGADGLANREVIGKIVFDDQAALAALEAELHPRVGEYWRNLAPDPTTGLLVVEIPLLFEKSLDAEFDLTVCVHCSHSMQIARLLDRGLPPEQAKARMRAQLPVEEKVRRSNLVIYNEGSRDFLAAQAELLIRRLTPSSSF